MKIGKWTGAGVGTLILIGAVVFLQLEKKESLPSKAGDSEKGEVISIERATPEWIAPAEAPRVVEAGGGLEGLQHGMLAERVEAVKALGNQLSRDQIEALYGFLRIIGEIDGLTAPATHVLKDAILNKLRFQKPVPVDLLETLEHLGSDPAQDEVTRQYALQHLTLLGDQDSTITPRVVEHLQRELENRSGANAGAALMGLWRLQGEGKLGEESLAQLRDGVSRLAADEKTPEPTRISAIAAAGHLQVEGIGKIARKIAGDPQAGVTLRVAAVAALRPDQPSDAGVLKKISTDQHIDERIRFAAREALRRGSNTIARK